MIIVMRRSILLLLTFLSVVSHSMAGHGNGSRKSATVVWNAERLDKVRKEMRRNELYRAACDSLLKMADVWLTVADPSVMTKPQAPASGDMHDYMSLSRYFWPDPASPDGLPWISRDGVSNPALDAYDRNRLGEMCDGVRILAVAHRLTGRKAYAVKARSMLRTWFLDPATRMNPNLDFSQVAMGHGGGAGRSSGSIDTYNFVTLLDAVEMLGGSGRIPSEEMTALRGWFSEMVDWMTDSKLAGQSRSLNNNLGLAYDAQLVRFALFAGRHDVARDILDVFVDRRLAPQIKENGSQPRELTRTKALHYSVYNIDHMLDVCAMGRSVGVDIYSGADRAVERALDFLTPFIGDREKFPYKQINEWELSVETCVRMLVRACGEGERADWRALYDRFRARPEDPLFVLLYL